MVHLESRVRRFFSIIAFVLCAQTVALAKTTPDNYKILGVERNANLREIKDAFNKLALKYHPDHNQGDEASAAAKFREVHEAYKTLSDEHKQYDQDSHDNSHPACQTMKDVLGTTAATQYRTAQEFKLELPGINQEICIPFGFTGSGDIFSPLPWVSVTLRATKTKTAAAAHDAPNMLALAKILAQDKLIQASKQFPLISWLSDQKLSPCKLFFLKTMLLVKDLYSQGDILYARNEIIRLVVRLSLTENNGVTDPTKPLSTHLPSGFTDLIKITCPQVIEIMDTFWKTLVSKPHEGDLAQTLADTRSFVGVVMVDATEASICFQDFKNYTGTTFHQDLEATLASKGLQQIAMPALKNVLQKNPNNQFAQKLYARQSFYTVNPTTTPADMPAELAQTVLKATTLPQTVMIKIGTETWVGQINTTLDMTETIKMTSVTLLTALKKYVAARTAYFKTHPVEAKEYVANWHAREQQTKLVKAFSETAQGKASIERLDQSFEKIKNNEVQEVSIVNRDNKLESLLADVCAKINALNDTITKTETQLSGLKRAQQNAGPAAAKLDASIKAIAAKLAQLQQERTELEIQQTSLTAQLNMTQPVAQAAKPNIAELEKLVQLAQTMQINGLEVPNNITQRIENLQKDIVAATQQHSSTKPNNQTLQQQTQHLAFAFQHEAKIILQEYAQRSTATAKLAADNIERMTFDLVTAPQYKAYIAHLEQEAINAATQRTFLHNVFGNSAELQEVLKDFADPTYKSIKDELINTLTVIAQRSVVLQENNTMFHTMIGWYFPELAPFFQELVNAPQLAFFGA